MSRLVILWTLGLSTSALGADAQFRFFIPNNVPIQEEAPDTQAEFTRANSEAGTFGVKLELELQRGQRPFRAVPLDTPICNGDQVAFRFTPSAGGYVNVVNHGTSGAWIPLWPARASEDPRFDPGHPVRLPTHEGFPVSGPSGDEYVLLFFSPGPFSGELQQLQDRLLHHEESGVVAGAATGGGTRQVRVTLLRDLGATSATYVVGQGEQTVAFTLNHRDSCDPLP